LFDLWQRTPCSYYRVKGSEENEGETEGADSQTEEMIDDASVDRSADTSRYF